MEKKKSQIMKIKYDPRESVLNTQSRQETVKTN